MRVWWVDWQTSFVRCFTTWLASISHLIFSPNQNWRPCFGRSLFSAHFTTHALLSSFDWFIGLCASVCSVDFYLSDNSGSDSAKSLSVPFFTVQIYPIFFHNNQPQYATRIRLVELIDVIAKGIEKRWLLRKEGSFWANEKRNDIKLRINKKLDLKKKISVTALPGFNMSKCQVIWLVLISAYSSV